MSSGVFAGDMDEHNQDHQYTQTPLISSQGKGYTTFDLSISCPDLLADLSSDRYRNRPQLDLPSSAHTLGNSVSADDQYYLDQISTFPSTTSMLRQQQQQQTAGFGSHNTGMMKMRNLPRRSARVSIFNTSQYATSLPSKNIPATSSWLLSDQADMYQSHFGTLLAEVSSATAPLEQESSEAYYQAFPKSLYYAWGVASGGGSSTGSDTDTSMESFYHLANLDAGSAANIFETSGVDKAAESRGEWQDYERHLANIFKEIIEGNLERAADELLSTSSWLLSRVEELGLTDENETLQKDRLKIWQDFNYAWIGLIFKQKQHMQQDRHGSKVAQPLLLRTVKRMGDELIRLCDGIEQHGLVDYQLGVWEDEIEILLEDCLKLFKESEKEVCHETNRNG